MFVDETIVVVVPPNISHQHVVMSVFIFVIVFLCVCRMDSFFLAEMFKYLYLLFSEKTELPIDIDDYIFTTEAHLLPVSLSTTQPSCQGNSSVSLAQSKMIISRLTLDYLYINNDYVAIFYIIDC